MRANQNQQSSVSAGLLSKPMTLKRQSFSHSMTPKNNPIAALQYPIYQNNMVQILYEKNEQKYRINNLLDIIRDRGEYSGMDYVFLNVKDNGYVYELNNSAIDYNKPAVERKKMRHFKNKVFLRRIFSTETNNRKMLFILGNVKKLLSSR